MKDLILLVPPYQYNFIEVQRYLARFASMTAKERHRIAWVFRVVFRAGISPWARISWEDFGDHQMTLAHFVSAAALACR